MTKACQNCRYFEPFRGSLAVSKTEADGECHAQPPQRFYTPLHDRTCFPEVDINDWCGHFVYKPLDEQSHPV